jgi:hypothetical protein
MLSVLAASKMLTTPKSFKPLDNFDNKLGLFEQCCHYHPKETKSSNKQHHFRTISSGITSAYTAVQIMTSTYTLLPPKLAVTLPPLNSLATSLKFVKHHASFFLGRGALSEV